MIRLEKINQIEKRKKKKKGCNLDKVIPDILSFIIDIFSLLCGKSIVASSFNEMFMMKYEVTEYFKKRVGLIQHSQKI